MTIWKVWSQREDAKNIILLIVLDISVFGSYITICQRCHGKVFEKRALGRSRIVRDLKKEEIIKRLNYFKISNSIMKSYASRLNKKQIREIANIFGK